MLKSKMYNINVLSRQVLVSTIHRFDSPYLTRFITTIWPYSIYNIEQMSIFSLSFPDIMYPHNQWSS